MSNAQKEKSIRGSIHEKIVRTWEGVRLEERTDVIEKLMRYARRGNVKKIERVLKKNKDWLSDKEINEVLNSCEKEEVKRVFREFLEKKNGKKESIVTIREKNDVEKVGEIIWAVTKSVAKKSNPVEIYKTLKKDIELFWKAKGIKDEKLVGDREKIKSSLELKNMSKIAISEFIGTYIGAVGVGVLLQAITKNPYMGVIGTIIGDYFPAFFSAEAVWLLLNWGYYTEKGMGNRVVRFYKDVLPFHAAALVSALPVYALGGSISSAMVALVNWLAPGIAVWVPIPIIANALNGIVGEIIYLSLFVGMSWTYIEKVLVERYNKYLEKKYKK